jgi:GNAT superfamily N-acetyltransferase
MKIRRATREDCPAMLKLIQELAEYEKMPEEVTVDPVHFEESGFGPNPVWWAFVVEEGKVEEYKVEEVEGVEVVEEYKVEEVEAFENVEAPSTLQPLQLSSTPSTLQPLQPIVALALYYIRYSTWKGQVMYLEDILVTESMRGRGIGKFLMDRLIEEAREKGFKKITWQVLDWNQPAIDFYKKYDVQFDPTWINVALDL